MIQFWPPIRFASFLSVYQKLWRFWWNLLHQSNSKTKGCSDHEISPQSRDKRSTRLRNCPVFSPISKTTLLESDYKNRMDRNQIRWNRNGLPMRKSDMPSMLVKKSVLPTNPNPPESIFPSIRHDNILGFTTFNAIIVYDIS